MTPIRVLSILAATLTFVIFGAYVIWSQKDESDEPARGQRVPANVRSAADRALLDMGAGPAGSAVVQLNRWRYRADPGVKGVRAGWATGKFGGHLVRVPYAPNGKGISGAAGFRNMAGTVGWFAREIKAPVTGHYAIAFESAHHHATVFVDGKRMRDHVGAYEPFSARPLLTAGRHEIVVRVDWRNPLAIAAAGYARGWFNYGGLSRPVTVARLGPTEFGALNVRTRLTPAGQAIVHISARVRSRTATARAVSVQGTLVRPGESHELKFDTVSVDSGRSEAVSATLTLDRPALWSPERPQRYDLRLEVPGEATLARKIGVREIRWGAGGLQLNGKPLVLRGVGLPVDARGRGDALRPIDQDRIVDELHEAGANAARSQLPLSESMLDRLDAAGILIWQLIGPWEPGGQHLPTSTPSNARDRALRTAEAGQAHPSILAWTLTNEINGMGRPDQIRYVTQAARKLHETDPTRPVAVDIWGSHLPASSGGLYDSLDAIGVTDYIGWYSNLDAGPSGQAQVASARLAQLRRLFADKPIVVSELGAIGSPAQAADAFGGLGFQASLMRDRLADLRGTPGVAGVIVWALRDYALRPDFDGGSVLKLRPALRVTPGLNEKGLYDFRGRPKPALAAVRRAFRRR